ncbi:sporulation-induced protein [Dispira simplex]|nr:sporulation-induced protein [Dispira simplex]
MFWRFGYHPQSNIQQLLDRPNVTLEELFAEEDLLQEVKGQSARLLDHLSEPGVLSRLLDYIVAEDFEHLQSRHTYLACEILSTDKAPFATVVVNHPELLEHLWGYLARPGPLHFLQASYFSRVMCTFLQKEPERILSFIKAQHNVVPQFLQHIESSAITDLLLKLLSFEDYPEGTGIAEWLSNEELIPRLVDLLEPHLDVDTHSMAGQVLMDIIVISQCNNPEQPSIGTNCLVGELKSEPIVSRIMGYMLDPDAPLASSSLVNGVFIFVELVRRNYSDANITDTTSGPSNSPHSPNGGLNQHGYGKLMVPVDLSDLIRVISDRLGSLCHLLTHPRNLTAAQPSTVGTRQPLGFERLRICELFAELLHCSNMYKLNVTPSSPTAPTPHPMSVSPSQTLPHLSESTSEPKVVFLNTTENASTDSAKEVATDVGTPHRSTDPVPMSSDPVEPTPESLMSTSESPAQKGAESCPVTQSSGDLTGVPVGQLLKWKIIEHRFMLTCLDLFFQFPWNNFLHTVVYDLVHQILNLPLNFACNQALVYSLFKDAGLTHRITSAYRLNQAECEKPKGVRFGYMGHLTGISEEVVRLFERCTSPLLDQLQEFIDDEEWQEYVVALREVKERDHCPLGGERPLPTDNMLAGLQGTSFLEPHINDMEEDTREDDDDDDDDEYGMGMGGIRSGGLGMGSLGGLGLLGGVGAGVEGDQFVRYLSHQITAELPEHLAGGSSDEDDEPNLIHERYDTSGVPRFINRLRHDQRDEDDEEDDEDVGIGWINGYRKELVFDRTTFFPSSIGHSVQMAEPLVVQSSSATHINDLADDSVFENRRSSLGALDGSDDNSEDDDVDQVSPHHLHPLSSSTFTKDGESEISITPISPNPRATKQDLPIVTDWSADFQQAFDVSTGERASPFTETITEAFDFHTEVGEVDAIPLTDATDVRSERSDFYRDDNHKNEDDDEEFTDFQQADLGKKLPTSRETTSSLTSATSTVALKDPATATSQS